MTILNRRRFILGAAGALTAALIGSVYRSDEEEIASMLRAKLPYLDLANGAPEAFAADFLANNTGASHGFLREILGSFGLVERMGGSEFEETVVTRFLLSSDFFRNGADETRTVRYLAYYDPYHYGCGNPFAELS